MRTLAVVLAATVGGCAAPEAPELPPVEAGAPRAGAAERTLDLPIGTPMGGFSTRAGYLSGQGAQDKRDSAYTVGFVESSGVHTRPMIKVVWLDNDNDHLVLIKTDTIYSFDGLVVEITRQLEEATGEKLEGRVTMTANHSHHSYGPFSDQLHFYLGGDKYNEEIFQRFAAQVVETSLRAYEGRTEASIGTAWARDWDPDDRVYRDRRGDNNDLKVWDDVEPGYGKDPYLNMLRIDEAETGDPIAAVFTFGIHGIALDADNPFISTDAPGGLELVIQEEFPEDTVVMHVQGAGGDASPAGRDREMPRIESVGVFARDAVLNLWEDTPTSDAPIRFETASRHIWQHHSDIHVTRNGTVDWRYTPLEDPVTHLADMEIFGPDGEVLAPIDEFNAPYGAAFCGSDAPLIPAGDIGVPIYPYSACMDVELVSRILLAIFKLEESELPLPLPESMKAGTTTSLIRDLPTREPDGTVVERPLYMGFFPAEPTAMFSEQFRRRADAELGYPMALTIGYAQDHEGYFLIPEDWLQGGYEPSIALWGPLQGEHVMERMLEYSGDLLGNDVHEDPDPLGHYAPTTYPDRPLPTLTPDVTPNAGRFLSESPEYLWVPDDFEIRFTVPETVRRVQDVVQIHWEGGDAMVDIPTLTLEREVDGSWEPVRTRSGRPVTDTFWDFLVGHTPDPLYPIDAEQVHYYWAAWQPVGHVYDRVSLPLGRYRIAVDGQHWTGSETTWPWTASPYRLESPAFELVGADIAIETTDDGLRAHIPAPDEGWRMIDIAGDSRGANPVRGAVTVRWGIDDDELGSTTIEGTHADGYTTLPVTLDDGATWVTLVDEHGNTGTLVLE